ncbi:uncharacterized protein LOC131036597 [Cryptomeria japonica]|uniref:uncharacterized protein LOC131036597 n=1 Tax=Cryptomeria japonica TaxID=3369 RepID=UPI0027D9F14E|nr:uncharacterized protein LOC131036597 [Cryptomeria japonica]
MDWTVLIALKPDKRLQALTSKNWVIHYEFACIIRSQILIVIHNSCGRFRISPVMESPDFYECIYQACHLREVSLQRFDPVLWYRAYPLSENGLMVLRLGLYEEGTHGPSKLVLDLGIYDILNCNEESIHNNLLPLLSYMFLGLYLPFFRSRYYSIANFISEFRRNLDRAGIIESTKYKRVFNLLFSGMCSFFTAYKRLDEDVLNVTRNGGIPQNLMQAQEETLLFIGPAGTHCFIHFLASYFVYNSVTSRALKISYNSSVEGFWRIASHSLLLSLEKTREPRIAEGKLQETSSHHLLNCILQFGHTVNICPHWIEVCLQMDNVTCDVLPPLHCDVPNEQHFPAKICLTAGPENGFGVQSVSLSVSSPNPITHIGRENSYEATFETPNVMGVKASASTTLTEKIKNWGFEQSTINGTDAKMDWTLYDSTTGKPVYNNELPKSSFFGHKMSSIGRYVKACRAFTEQGGVVFAKDDYGKPITWRLNRDLEGQTLKWIVKASIWLTCLPNTRYSHTRRHDFQQVVDLKL